MAFIDGAIGDLLEFEFLRYILSFIVYIAYFMAVYPFMMRSREKAVLAFKPLLSLEDDAFDKVATNISKPNRRLEWTAIFLGISFYLGALGQPWTLDWASDSFWLTVYFVFTVTIVYGLISWLIYDTLIGIVRVSRLSRYDLKLDVLDTEMLSPIARWSLVISLVFVGALSLSVIAMWEIMLEWQTITGFVITICITVLIFYLSMWTAHRAMNEAKKRKLALVKKHLAGLSRELDGLLTKGHHRGTEKLSSTINMWITYEKRVKEAPTWPFNAGIVSRLAMSLLMPAAIFLIKIIGQFWARFGF
jgi:hypothetical protein